MGKMEGLGAYIFKENGIGSTLPLFLLFKKENAPLYSLMISWNLSNK